MSAQEAAFSRVWMIENDRVRRAVMVIAWPTIAVARIVSTPVLMLAVIVVGLGTGILRAVQEIFEVLTSWQGEARMWRQFPRAWKMVWATSYERRPQSRIIRKDLGA